MKPPPTPSPRAAARFPAALALAALALAAAPAGAQGVVSGRVVDERGEPVAAARVSVPRLDRATVTTDHGTFALRDLPPGRHALLAARIGFAPARLAATLGDGADTVRVEIVLARSAIALAAVQVTATPTAAEPRAVAQSTTTLEGADLQRQLGATIGATLAMQPGVAARSQGPAASAPIIRGLSGDRIVVLHDGQRAGDLAATAPDHGITIDPAAAARIEVVRGPAALLYGNNAIGGVVNVVSGDIPTLLADRATGSLTLAGESASRGGGASVEATAPLGARSALALRAGARSHDDVRLGAGADTRLLDGSHLRAANGSIGLSRVGERGSAGGAFRHYRFEYGLPASGGLRLRGDRHEALARAELRPRGSAWLEAVRVEGSAQWYGHDEIAPDGVVATALGVRTRALQAMARTRPLGPFRDGAVGLSAIARRNGVTGSGALTPANGSGGVGVFALQELPVGAVRIPIGARWDRHVLESDASERFGPARRRVFQGLSGSVGIVVPVADGVTAAANVARAVRSPTAEELFSQAGHAGTGAFEIGDPELAPERSTGVDAVLRVERRALTASLALWRNAIRRYIALYPAGRDTLVSDGAGGTKRLPLHVVSQRDATLRGVEAQVEALVRGRWVVGAMADALHARDAEGAPLPFLPPARVGLSARHDDGRLRAGASVRRVLAQGRVPAGELRAGAHTLVDAHVALRLTSGGRAHDITLRADNATDALYRDATSRIKHVAPAPGRNVVVGWRWEW